jgi:hypothetical protein
VYDVSVLCYSPTLILYVKGQLVEINGISYRGEDLTVASIWPQGCIFKGGQSSMRGRIRAKE